ncbi:hypothetical protein OG689_05435 [Kitasatospora sp. NBC_00240]|nr:hypothetical protein [Kitasatospora sp. NBC_00240]MCX5208741.1 hypothetical protein [Kitasatospora sp. NBC_00240]
MSASLRAAAPPVPAIPGPGSPDHRAENLAVDELVLGEKDLSYLRG